MGKKTKIIKFGYLVFFILIIFIITSVAIASPLKSVGRFTSCAGGGILDILVIPKIEQLTRLIPGFSRIFSSSVPVNDVILNPRYLGKEYVQDLLARCTAREILTAMNRAILDVARTAGRDGGPAFIRNWRSFILTSQYRGEDIWRGMVYIAANGGQSGVTPPLLCNHIRNSQAIKSLQPTPLPNLVQSSLNRRVNNLQDVLISLKCDPDFEQKREVYRNDFVAGGGFDTFAKSLSAQNRTEGVANILLNELGEQRSIEERSDVNEAIAGSGFTSIRGTSTANSSCVIAGLGGTCIVYRDIKTPGSVIFGGINAATEQELAFVANADELNEVIATAIQVLFNRMIDLANRNEGDYQIPGDVDFNPNFLPPQLPPQNEENPGAPPPQIFGTVIVNFQITNNNSGSATANDFTLFINGEQTAIGLSRVLPVGNYVINTGSPSGYTLIGIKGACDGDGSFTLGEGQNLTCTVTYDDT